MDTTVLHNCSVTPSWIRSISCKTWTLLGHCICTSISKTCALCISKAGALFVHVECTSLHGKLLGTAMSTAVPAVEQHAWGLGHAPRIIRPPTSQKGSMKVHAPTSLYPGHEANYILYCTHQFSELVFNTCNHTIQVHNVYVFSAFVTSCTRN